MFFEHNILLKFHFKKHSILVLEKSKKSMLELISFIFRNRHVVKLRLRGPLQNLSLQCS